MTRHELPESTVFDLFRTTRRRHVVDVVAARGAVVSRSELLAELTERPGIGAGDADALSARLYHVDLPKLHEHGVVEFDPGEDCVRPTELTPTVSRRLEQYGR